MILIENFSMSNKKNLFHEYNLVAADLVNFSDCGIGQTLEALTGLFHGYILVVRN
jgi:hypothetical protein